MISDRETKRPTKMGLREFINREGIPKAISIQRCRI